MGSFPYAPGMVDGYGGGSPSGLIEKYLGEAYANVLAVADEIPAITTLLTNIAQINAVATAIANGANFTGWTWGQIVGTLTAQTDLTAYITSRLTNYQPSNVNLAALAGLSMSGNGGRVLKVNVGGTGLEFDVDTSGSGGGTLAPADYGDITVNVDETMTVTHVGGLTAATIAGWNAGKINSSAIGAASGVCPLDGTSKISATYLPSYVDDVLEVANFAALPGTGETGKIYVTLDTNFEYRWSGSTYIRIVASPGSTDALTEGATNLYFTNARAQAALSVSLANKADLVGGRVAASQLPTNIPYISSVDTGMEIGQYIDFHTLSDGLDYQARIQSNTGGTLDITTRLGLVTVSASDLAIATNNRYLKFMGASGNYSSFVNQSDNNFAFYATHADGSARAVWSILTHSDTSNFHIYPDVSMDGNLTVTGEITSPSDIRLKSDVVPLLNASEIVSLLGGYRFIMDGREQIGVIAQQVQKVLPELIQIDAEGWLSVNYAKLTAVLIADNNAMRARLNTLEARISRLEGR